MRIILSCLVGLAVLAVLALSGAMTATDLAHPFWLMSASQASGAGGVVLAAGLLWLQGSRAGLAKVLGWAALVLLPLSALVTWRAARVFIDSADFQPLAGKLWFLGYHALAGLIVLTVAWGVARVLWPQPASGA